MYALALTLLSCLCACYFAAAAPESLYCTAVAGHTGQTIRPFEGSLLVDAPLFRQLKTLSKFIKNCEL